MIKQKTRELHKAILNDIRKEPKRNWQMVGLIWVLILYTFFSGIGVKAHAIEDYSESIKGPHFGDKLKAQIYSLQNDWTFPQKTFFTSYNPEVGQTDASPCIGANGTNVCDMATQGIRTIALSQDLVGRGDYKQFKYGDKVRLYSENPQCNGVFQVEDTLNSRYTNRGDIFCLDRSCNTSCWVTITKL